MGSLGDQRIRSASVYLTVLQPSQLYHVLMPHLLRIVKFTLP